MAKKKKQEPTPFEIPTEEEAIKQTIRFEEACHEQFMRFGMPKMPKGNHIDDLTTVCGIASNFILGTGHKKCGCPGLVGMIYQDKLKIPQKSSRISHPCPEGR